MRIIDDAISDEITTLTIEPQHGISHFLFSALVSGIKTPVVATGIQKLQAKKSPFCVTVLMFTQMHTKYMSLVASLLASDIVTTLPLVCRSNEFLFV